jgi:hypothetical protein
MVKVKEAKEPTIIQSEFDILDVAKPYVAQIKIQGACPFLFHRWSCDDIESKANAKKGSKEKKTDNLESFVYRNEKGQLCIPGEYLRMAIIYASKFKSDPRSPRKSAFDLFKAGVVPITDLAPLNGGQKEWDMIDRRRVVIQRSGITRQRPAMQTGWTAEIDLQVLAPEYIDQNLLYEVLSMAGRLIGVGDFRPTFGRFNIVGYSIS